MPSCNATPTNAGRLDRRPLLICLLLIGATIQALPGFTLPETTVWVGKADSTWSNPDNWNPSGVPGPGDTVSFDSASPNCTIDIAEVQIAGLLTAAGFSSTIDGSGATVTLSTGLALNGGTISGSPDVVLLGGSSLNHSANVEVPGNYQLGTLEFRSSGTTVTPTFDASEFKFTTLLIGPDADVQMTSELVQPNVNNVVPMDTLAVAGTLSYGDINFRVDSILRLFADGGSTPPSITVTAATSTTGFLDFRGSQWDLQAGKIVPGEYFDWILAATEEVAFLDADGLATPTLQAGEPIYLRVVDQDRNLDAGVAETLAVTVTNPDLLAGEELEQEFAVLTETGPSTGIFTNLGSGLATDAETAATATNESLSIPVIANLEARYSDGLYETTTYDYFYGTAAHFWVGGGETDSWYDSANWFTNEIPSRTSTAIFGKSDAACRIDDAADIGTIRLTSVYAGTVTVASDFTFSTCLVRGGTLATDATPVMVSTGGDLIQTGGAVNMPQATMNLNATTGQQLVLSDASIGTIGTVYNATVSGSATVAGHIEVSSYEGPTSLTLDGDFSCATCDVQGNATLTLASGSRLQVIERLTTGAVEAVTARLGIEDAAVLDLRTATWTQTTIALTETGTGHVQHPSSALQFVDANGEPVSSQTIGEPLFTSVVDKDANTASSSADAVSVVVTDLIGGDSESISLSESSLNSAIFNNTASGGLATAASDGTVAADDGTLEIVAIGGASYVQLVYQDSQDSTDRQQVGLVDGAIYWDDDSEDGLWSTAANWSGDAVPTVTDTVLFGPGAQSDCRLSSEVTVAGLVMTDDYGGALDTAGLLCNTTNLQLHGGAVAENGIVTCSSEAVVAAATLANSILWMEDSESSTLTTSADPIASLILDGAALTWQASATPVATVNIYDGATVTLQGSATTGTVGHLGNLVVASESTLTVSTSFTQIDDGAIPSTVIDGGRIISQGAWYIYNGTVTERNGGIVQHPATGLTVTDASGTPLTAVTLGSDDLLLTIDDGDENDGSASPTVQVTVTSSDTGDSETVTLALDTELGFNGRFTSSAALPTAESATATVGDGTLQAFAGDTLFFNYQDDEDPEDSLQTSLSTAGGEPTPTLPTVDLVADDLLLFEGQAATVGLVLSAASESTVSVQLRITDPGESGLGENDFAGDFTLAIPAGTTTATFELQSTQDATPEAIGHGFLLLASATGADLAAEAQAVSIELRDDDADGEPLALSTASPIEVATVGASITLLATDGTPPYSFSATNATFNASPPLAGAYDLDGDGDNDLGQRLLLSPLAEGAVTVTVSDAEGASSDLTLTAVAGSPSTTPPPSVPVSDGAAAIYLPIATATAEGRQRLIDLATAAADDEQRLFAWSAADQAYIELPEEPAGGLLPGQGIFLASRAALALDLSGSAAVLPFDILLAPGWNFIGIPALATETTTFDFTGLDLFDEGGFTLDTATRQNLIGDHAFFFDGAAYQPATTLVPGNGYWIFNASADPAQTLTLRLSASGQSVAPLAADAKTNASAGHRWTPAASGPPAPPSAPAASASPTASPGGCGAGIALLMLPLLLLGFARWQRAS